MHLKTPLVALVSDAGRLRERGEHAIAHDIEALGEAMSRHGVREMTRARVRANVRRGVSASTELAPLVRSLIAILARTPVGMWLTFEPRIPDGRRHHSIGLISLKS